MILAIDDVSPLQVLRRLDLVKSLNCKVLLVQGCLTSTCTEAVLPSVDNADVAVQVRARV